MAPVNPKKYLNEVYDLKDLDSTKDFYRRWAESYEREVADGGYITPQRCAAKLAANSPEQSQPVLDVGCGTGLSGIALRDAGFKRIDGVDISEEMLQRASESGIYRRTFLHDFSDPLPIQSGAYAHAVASGAIGLGHAPPATIDHVIAILPPGGMFVFSLNDHALKEPAFEGCIHMHVDCGSVEVLDRKYGAHLPGIGLKAVIYALRKRG